MTGAQIANNLENEGRFYRWGQGNLINRKVRFGKLFPAYCVLGIKAAEAGATKEQLRLGDYLALRNIPERESLDTLMWLNDYSGSKQELIAVLRSPQYANMEFNVEGFVAEVLKLGKS